MTASTNAAAVPVWHKVGGPVMPAYGDYVLVMTTDADDDPLAVTANYNGKALFLGVGGHKVKPATHWMEIPPIGALTQPAAAPLSGWISVDAALPEHDEEGAAHVWAAWNGAAGFALGPRTGEARYIKTLGWQPMGTQGWDWNVSHWMLMPEYPGTEAAPVEQDPALTGAQFAAAQHLQTVQAQADALEAARAECDLLSASLKQADGVRDGLMAALRRISEGDVMRGQLASTGCFSHVDTVLAYQAVARAAIAAAGEAS